MLADIAIPKAMPAQRPCKLADSAGLFFLVNPNGMRCWRLRYRIGTKERGISLGVYPEVSLKRAREKPDEAQPRLADGIDPAAIGCGGFHRPRSTRAYGVLGTRMKK